MSSGDIIRLGTSTYIRDLLAGENLTVQDPVFMDGSAALKTKAVDAVLTPAVTYWDCCYLSDNKVLVVYITANNPTGVVVTVNASTGACTLGSPVTLYTAGATGAISISCCNIDTDKAIVAYYDATATVKLAAKVISVSGTTITTGAEATLQSGTACSSGIGLGKSNTNAAVCIYGVSTPATKCQVMTVSGTTITVGSAVNLDAAVARSMPTVRQLATNVVLACSYEASGATLGVNYISVSGTVPTIQTAVEMTGSVGGVNASYDIQPLSATRFIIHWSSHSGNAAYIVIGGVSGTTVSVILSSWAVPVSMTGTVDFYAEPSLMRLSDTTARLSLYARMTLSYTGSAYIFTQWTVDITGDTVTLVKDKRIIDGIGASGAALGRMISLTPSTPVQGLLVAKGSNGVMGNIIPNCSYPIGICNETTAAGNNAPILLSGYSNKFSGLTAGGLYGVAQDGTLSVIPYIAHLNGLHHVGQALSATELLIKPIIDRFPLATT